MGCFPFKFIIYNLTIYIKGVETKPLPPLVPKLNSFAYLTDMFIVPVCPVHRGQTTGGPENEPGMYVTLVYADMEDCKSFNFTSL